MRCTPKLLFTLLCYCGLVTGAAAETVYPSAEDTQPLAAGATVPSVEVETVAGKRVDLAALTENTGALLVFYRGGW